MHVALVLPCYNPPPDWSQRVAAAIHTLQAARPRVNLQVVLVNDGSTHGVTAADLDFLRQRLPGMQYVSHAPNRGKGFALRAGVAVLDAQYYLYTDIDFPYTEASMLAVLDTLLCGTDVAIGVRHTGYYAQVPGFRRVLSRTFRWVLRRVLRLPVTDTQAGLKGFSPGARPLFLHTRIRRYLFDLEFIYRVAGRPGLQVQAVPVTLRPQVTFRKLGLRVLFTESVNFLRIVVSGR
ncbi:MAG: glycosyltransferase [Bacteroidetes bacterium]|nr:glycosyltransferase [Bacteroidota bacterium]